MRWYLGIDPGLSGALAFYDPLNNELDVFDMPTIEIKVAKKRKREVDLHQLANLIDDYGDNTKVAAIEKVGSMPGQGVTSCFNFGFSAGVVNMAVVQKGIKLIPVTPSVWKREMRVTKDKETARREASRLLPEYSREWALKKHDGRAEAALLAYYISQRERGLSADEKPTMESML